MHRSRFLPPLPGLYLFRRHVAAAVGVDLGKPVGQMGQILRELPACEPRRLDRRPAFPAACAVAGDSPYGAAKRAARCSARFSSMSAPAMSRKQTSTASEIQTYLRVSSGCAFSGGGAPL